MANTKTVHIGDGIQTTFAVSFPYLSPTHLVVTVNGLPSFPNVDFTIPTLGSVVFLQAPPPDAVIEIRRSSSIDQRLVDYNDGSVLIEDDLDLDSTQAFYLIQEINEAYVDLINGSLVALATANGLVITDPADVIAQLVQNVLNDELAAELQQRINDIDANAQAILTNALSITGVTDGYLAGDASLQAQINAIANATAGAVYVQPDEPVPGVNGIPDPIPDNARWYDSDDNLHPYIWDGQALEWLSLLDPQVGVNAANIASISVALDVGGTAWEANANAFQVLDATITTINGELVSQSSDITNLQSSITNAEAGIAANASAVSSLTTRVTATEGSIDLLSNDIQVLQGSLTDLDNDVQGNFTALTALGGRVTTAEGNITSNASDISALLASVNTLDGEVAGNSSALSSLNATVSAQGSNISANASSITSLSATVGSNSSSITSLTSVTSALQGDITTLEARYGVSLNVNGYVTGFEQFNNGDSGTFSILADRFFVVDPASNGQNPTAVFGIQDGNVFIQNAFVTNAWIADLSVGKLTVGTLNADINLGTGHIVFDNGAYKKVIGNGFGSSNQFVDWFGPSVALNQMTENNAIAYQKTNGDAFFGGTLTVGTLSTSGQTSDLAANAQVTIGPLGTNGGPIAVNFSYTYQREGIRNQNNGNLASNFSATVRLYRTIGTGSEQLVSTMVVNNGNIDGFFSPVEGQWFFTETASGSQTYTDSAGGTSARTYRVAITSRTETTIPGSSPSPDDREQRVAVTSSEN